MSADCIIIKGLQCAVRVGVNKEEQEVKRNCEIDIRIYYNLSSAGASDDLNTTLNYSKVFHLIHDLSGKVSYKLLEAFTYRIFQEIFQNTDAKRISLKVKKMNPPIEGRFQYVAVSMTRNREDFIK